MASPVKPRQTSHRSHMTWWSRHDPAMLPQGNSDHWSKMKSQATTFVLSQNPLGQVEVRQTPPGVIVQEKNKKTYEPTQARFRYNKDGTVSRIPGDEEFGEQVSRSLNNNMPGNYFMTQYGSCPSRQSVPSVFSERAKQGHRYWYQERPKPTKFGRYGIGSYKTVLGLGNAPRT